MNELVKKQQRGEVTKKKILEVALKLFSEKGFNKVTVDEIVKKSAFFKRLLLSAFPIKIRHLSSAIYGNGSLLFRSI